MNYCFPSQRPDKSPSELWGLQLFLLSESENRLGVHETGKQVYQPTFSNNVPHIINTPKLDGAFACLSDNAAGYWPTALYELAHETVHLLNPVPGFTTYLEEGIAIHFAVDMSHNHSTHPQSPQNNAIYEEAWKLVKMLPDSPYIAAQSLREKYGALSSVKMEDILLLFPQLSNSIAVKLAETCKPG